MAGDMELVRDSLKSIRNDVGEIRGSIGKIYDKLDQHERDCPALKAFYKRPSISPQSKMSWIAILTKLGPFILAAALGLLGFGFYWGSTRYADKMEDDMATVKKLLKEKTDEPHSNN